MYAHPGLIALRETVKERKEWQFNAFAQRLLAGDYPDEEDVEYARGFFAGMNYLLDKPKLHVTEIQKELRKRSVKADA